MSGAFFVATLVVLSLFPASALRKDWTGILTLGGEGIPFASTKTIVVTAIILI